MDSVEFDHHSPELANDEIWAAYARLREAGAVSFSAAHDGTWLIASHRAAKSTLRDHSAFSSCPSHRHPQGDVPPIVPIDFDPPEHTRFRDAMMEAVRPARLQALDGFLDETVTKVLDAFVENGGGDARHHVSIVLPFRVLTGVLGISTATVDALLASHRDAPWTDDPDAPSHHSQNVDIRDLLQDEVARHREGTGERDDYIDWLLREQVDGGLITEEEAVELLLTFAVSGFRTTMNSVSNLFYLLASDRGIQDLLRADPSLATGFVEEMLRLRPPAHNVARTTTCPVDVEGRTIPAGARVVVSLAAANRDDAQYEDPDEFDPRRPTRGHLGFGWGIHQCLGAPLARAELKAFLNALVRFPPFRLREVEFTAGVQEGLHYGPAGVDIVFDAGEPQTTGDGHGR